MSMGPLPRTRIRQPLVVARAASARSRGRNRRSPVEVRLVTERVEHRLCQVAKLVRVTGPDWSWYPENQPRVRAGSSIKTRCRLRRWSCGADRELRQGPHEAPSSSSRSAGARDSARRCYASLVGRVVASHGSCRGCSQRVEHWPSGASGPPWQSNSWRISDNRRRTCVPES
jgi:hypothetical protein